MNNHSAAAHILTKVKPLEKLMFKNAAAKRRAVKLYEEAHGVKLKPGFESAAIPFAESKDIVGVKIFRGVGSDTLNELKKANRDRAVISRQREKNGCAAVGVALRNLGRHWSFDV